MVTACAIDVVPSALPVTFTWYGVLHVPAATRTVAGDTTAVAADPLVTDNTTAAPGSLFKRSRYLAVPPAARTDTERGSTITP